MPPDTSVSPNLGNESPVRKDVSKASPVESVLQSGATVNMNTMRDSLGQSATPVPASALDEQKLSSLDLASIPDRGLETPMLDTIPQTSGGVTEDVNS